MSDGNMTPIGEDLVNGNDPQDPEATSTFETVSLESQENDFKEDSRAVAAEIEDKIKNLKFQENLYILNHINFCVNFCVIFCPQKLKQRNIINYINFSTLRKSLKTFYQYIYFYKEA